MNEKHLVWERLLRKESLRRRRILADREGRQEQKIEDEGAFDYAKTKSEHPDLERKRPEI